MIQSSEVILRQHPYIDHLYSRYKKDPTQVDKSWHTFFKNLEKKNFANTTSNAFAKEMAVAQLIKQYRTKGHTQAHVDPLTAPTTLASFDTSYFGLTVEDLSFGFESIQPLQIATLGQAIEKLKKIYCHTIGFEYQHIQDTYIKKWLQDKIEKNFYALTVHPSIQKHIAQKLLSAQNFESFLQKRYLGQKRFSLEGGESMIVALDTCIQKSVQNYMHTVVIGMAHRGRLNVLANILQQPLSMLFGLFEEKNVTEYGDVKYHLGYHHHIQQTQIQLLPNPSHLEFVNAVAQGYAKAIAQKNLIPSQNVMPLLIHGDAALAGQGIGYELAQMSQLPAYNVGGIIHLVINNQIGFTTETTVARTSFYCTDVAKVIDAPVLHVNGDDPEAVYFAMQLAFSFRQKFARDIFIDLVCYRKYGHNESDEPRFTQPTLYQKIRNHTHVVQKYTEKLLANHVIDESFVQAYNINEQQKLQKALDITKQFSSIEPHLNDTHKFPSSLSVIPTTVSLETIHILIEKLTSFPQGFTPLKQIKKLFEKRRYLYSQEKKIDWATAELLAYATLLLSHNPVRLVGQDVQRGTFSHRHAVLKDSLTNLTYPLLNHLHPEQALCTIENSLLSENAALGFEFGYALAHTQALTIWEAQFGDFSNGAQVIIDQFIGSAKAKWGIAQGLVMLLPHGYEGQGPEHSSARLERFLQLCAQENLQIANLTTPANLFHLLRRQALSPQKIPLVIMSPKSLLRHPKVLSAVEDCTTQGFLPVIDDALVAKTYVRKILFCSGKIYYELLQKRVQEKKNDVAIIRIEVLYPFPQKSFEKILQTYPQKITYAWVQEEPENMGACHYIKNNLSHFNDCQYITRAASPTPATGYGCIHRQEQEQILNQAFQ